MAIKYFNHLTALTIIYILFIKIDVTWFWNKKSLLENHISFQFSPQSTFALAISECLFFLFYHRSVQSLYWFKFICINQLQTHCSDRALNLRYHDGKPSHLCFPSVRKHRGIEAVYRDYPVIIPAGWCLPSAHGFVLIFLFKYALY